MKFTSHLIASPVLLSISYFNGIEYALIAVFASLAIDADHIYLLFKERAFSYSRIKKLNNKIYDIYQKDPDQAFKNVIYFFHTVEFNLILFIFSLFIPWLQPVFIGFLFHILCDIIHHKLHGMPIMRWLSLIYFIKLQ